jgi:hypothetical protein
VTVRRCGFTLAETAVAVVLAAIVAVLLWQAVLLLSKSEKATDRAASRASMEARLMETLLKDVRSGTQLQAVGPGRYEIKRWVLDGNRMVERTVTWGMKGPNRVERTVQGEPRVEFDFTGLLDPGMPAFRLRLETIPDGEFSI